jgi:hypothetical protein
LKDTGRIKPLMQELKKAELALGELLPRWETLMHGLEDLDEKKSDGASVSDSKKL